MIFRRRRPLTPINPDKPAEQPKRVVRIHRQGNLGNQMIQHLAALTLIDGIPGCEIEGVGVPDWNITHSPVSSIAPDLIFHEQDFDIERARAVLKSENGGCVLILGYAQRREALGSVEKARKLFHLPSYLEGIDGFSDNQLVINLRAGEIEDAIHPDYVLLPVGYYKDICQHSGKEPVFFGQFSDSPYFQALRSEFPKAEFVPSVSPMHDFAKLIKSRNIACCVSTFSWMASWLSEADNIYVPIVGLFNPMQTLTNTLSMASVGRRYHLFSFPISFSQQRENVLEHHRALMGKWSLTPLEIIEARHENHPLAVVTLDSYLDQFDESFYLEANPDVCGAVQAGVFTSAKEHFIKAGFSEGRNPSEFDSLEYLKAYPTAASEISRGDYLDAKHHWVTIGARRGWNLDSESSKGTRSP